MSYVYNMSYVDNMSIFYESLKITCLLFLRDMELFC